MRPRPGRGHYNTAAFDFEFSFQHNSYGFGIDAVFFFQDFFRERRFRIRVLYWNYSLQHDGASVEIFVDKVYGATGEFYSVFEGLALGFETGERREQRRVNVQDAIWVFRDKEWGEQAHVAGEADQFHLVLVENGSDLAVVNFALETF
jgi:hypothetical protein